MAGALQKPEVTAAPMKPASLRVLLLKPSKYGVDGYVERFRRGFMPNSTLPHLNSLTPPRHNDCVITTQAIDEYVETDLDYLRLLQRDRDRPTLLALVGVQSHQFHRALDLAAYARRHGVEHVVLGGPHPMTCDTESLHGRGVSFAAAEAEIVWPTILEHAMGEGLRPFYGDDERWIATLDPPALIPPPESNMRKYAVQMLGIYPARGCPYRCSFCSVIKIAGQRMRGQPVETTNAVATRGKTGRHPAHHVHQRQFQQIPRGCGALASNDRRAP